MSSASKRQRISRMVDKSGVAQETKGSIADVSAQFYEVCQQKSSKRTCPVVVSRRAAVHTGRAEASFKDSEEWEV
eukprot:3696529-Pyramimonas_sp.AAC.1